MQPDIFIGLVESKEGIKLAMNWKALLSDKDKKLYNFQFKNVSYKGQSGSAILKINKIMDI